MTTIETSTTTTPATVTTEGPHNRFAEAYERHLPEMLALRPEELAPINIEIPIAITTVRGALPGIMALRQEAATRLQTFPLVVFDSLEGYALATVHAHGLWVAASEPAEDLARLYEKALATRQIFVAELQNLVRRGLLDGAVLTEFKGLQGYRNVAFDLVNSSSVLRGAWPRIHGRTGIQFTELDEASENADQILTAVAHREQTPVEVTGAAQNRQRAFTLLVQAYDQVRRAVGFLRWNENDADAIAPSFFAGRMSNKRKGESPRNPAPPAVPAPEPVGEPAVAVAAPMAAPRAAQVGMPGSRPFIS